MKALKIPGVIKQIRWKEILAVVILLLAFVFFRSERHELTSIGPQLSSSDPVWICAGIFLSLVYIFLQGLMYVTSFKSVGMNIKISDAVGLFLKRNFLSVFLPAGGVSSLAYLPRNIRILGYKSSKIHQASAIYGFVGLLTVLIVGIPLLIYAVSINKNLGNSWSGILILCSLLFILYGIFLSFRERNGLYRFIERKLFKKTSRSYKTIGRSKTGI